MLTDSLASSLFVVVLAAAARIALRADFRVRTMSVAVVGVLGAGLMRTEKAAVVVVVAALLLVVLWWQRSRSEGSSATRKRGRVSVALVVALLVPAVVAGVVNHVTQTADLGRIPPGMMTAAVNRAVWPHLTEIRDSLPPEARAAISPQDATEFDSHNNNVLPMVARMRVLDAGGDAITVAAVRAALDCCSAAIARDTAGDALKYASTPLVFAVEGTGVLMDAHPADTPTAWDVSRMAARRPWLTHFFLVVSFVLLALLLGWVLVPTGRARVPLRRFGPYALVVWGGTVVNGCFFALAQGADANVRYGLSGSMAIAALLAGPASAALFCSRSTVGGAAPAVDAARRRAVRSGD